jgi:hypothetical protein
MGKIEVKNSGKILLNGLVYIIKNKIKYNEILINYLNIGYVIKLNNG